MLMSYLPSVLQNSSSLIISICSYFLTTSSLIITFNCSSVFPERLLTILCVSTKCHCRLDSEQALSSLPVNMVLFKCAYFPRSVLTVYSVVVGSFLGGTLMLRGPFVMPELLLEVLPPDYEQSSDNAHLSWSWKKWSGGESGFCTARSEEQPFFFIVVVVAEGWHGDWLRGWCRARCTLSWKTSRCLEDPENPRTRTWSPPASRCTVGLLKH